MIIESVDIDGFWGNKKAVAQFNQDVTIFIGLNGTGKSTFVNLIAATLSLDLAQLSSLQFETIRIKLSDRKTKRTRTIKVSRQTSDDSIGVDTYEYRVGNRSYRLFTEPRIVRSRDRLEAYRRLSPHIREEQLKLKKELSTLVEISQISVYRQSYDQSLEYDTRQRFSAVDERLKQLFEKFARYQLKLETRLNEISKKIQQDAVLSLLYNEQFDQFNLKTSKLNQIDLKGLSEKLYLAFKELGIQNKNKDIERHIQKIESALGGLKSKNSAFQGDDVLALPLIYRTNHIIDSLNQSEKEKNEITEARQNFFETIHSFMSNKRFFYDNKTGELSFRINQEGEQSFPWTNLSSGEKQLLIQFLEVLLQESKSVIFIADEPEISLHVTWQENLLKAIRNLNENAQLIIATHSPDIVADFRDKVLDMQEVVSV